MDLEIVELDMLQMEKLMPFLSNEAMMRETLAKAYFSDGSIAYCVLADDDPVFAGGIVNLKWKRGEAWIIPTPFFRQHLKTCLGIMRNMLPGMAEAGHFVRVQAVAQNGTSPSLFKHLGFEYEGRLRNFGPHGEDCSMFSRIFSNGANGKAI